MQPPAQIQQGNGLPDFSGFGLIASFARLPAERTKLESLCEIRRISIEEATSSVNLALQNVRESVDPAKAVRLHNTSATIYLYKGDTANAIAQFEEALRIVESHITDNAKMPAMRNIVLAAVGIAHMRRGEVENCVTNRNADVCIFPLTTLARHKLRSGSERAIEYFERYLEKEPSSLEVRWLLNSLTRPLEATRTKFQRLI